MVKALCTGKFWSLNKIFTSLGQPSSTHSIVLNIGIKQGFPCINVCQVPREMLKTEAEGRGSQQLPRDLANVNALENNVGSLLLHKFNYNAKNITKMAGHYFPPHRNYLADSYMHYPFL